MYDLSLIHISIGYYWGTRVNSFYDIGMNLDLKGKISEEIVSNVNEGMLEPCLGENGEIYALPMKTVYHTTFYNKDVYKRQVPYSSRKKYILRSNLFP